MADYCLSCSSTVDVSEELLNQRDLRWVPFHFELAGEDHLDDLWKSMDYKEMYRRMLDGAMTKTSQVGVGEYIAHFRKMLDEGKDILHATLSTGISGTYNSACTARDMLKEEYPDRKIYVVDSLCASAGYGLFMVGLADKRDEGMDIDSLYAWAQEHRTEARHWFFSTDLTFYIRGGRVSKAAGFFGTVLNICPLLDVDIEGRLIPREKIRTKKKVIARIVEKMQESAFDGADYARDCFISHSDCLEDAQAVADLIGEKFPHLKGKVQVFNIGATIGSHTGPGTVALFFWGNKRTN